VHEFLDACGLTQPRLQIGLPDRYIEHGSRDECLAAAGLDKASVAMTVTRWWQSLPAGLNSNRSTPRMAVAARSAGGTATLPPVQPPKVVQK
jgi:hypothetical protein